MEAKEKAKELINIFGKEVALKVVDELLKRDKNWIEKLFKEYPQDWSLSDYDKSIEMFNNLKNEIKIIYGG